MTLVNRFERRPKVTIAIMAVVFCLTVLAVTEILLRWYGLGDPVLYQSSPLYGYRLQPNQLVSRIGGAEVRVNNLGLRADRDWDSSRVNKVLFLGNSVTFGGTYIGTTELFSHRAVQGLEGYVGGNAGVNGWGIENIHALVVDGGFTPASIYVSVLQEMDFYRGNAKLAGKPFWTTKPAFAIEELLIHFFLDRFNTIYEDHDRFVTHLENRKTVERSVRRLKELDDFLKSKGFSHLIYLSTNIHQLTREEEIDTVVHGLLKESGLDIRRMKDRPEIAALGIEKQLTLFYDWNHLSSGGHGVWAEIIKSDLRNLLSRR